MEQGIIKPCTGIIIDFKSKQEIEDGKKMAWEEHSIQLSAYGFGMGIERPRGINIFIGVDDQKVSIHEWEPEELARGWEMFQALLTFWKIKNKIEP